MATKYRTNRYWKILCVGGIAFSSAMACSLATVNAQPAPAPWETGRPTGLVQAEKPPVTAGGTDTVDPAPPTPQDPKLTRLLPYQPKGATDDPDSTMRTARSFGNVLQSCIVTKEDAACTSHGAGTDAQQSNQVVVTWQYGPNRTGEPILLFTVKGHPQPPMGLQLVYGSSATAGDAIAEGDFLGAVHEGAASMAPADLLGCAANCVYGAMISERKGLDEALRAGRAIGLRYVEGGRVHEISIGLTGMTKAMADMPTARTRRLDPTTHGAINQAWDPPDVRDGPAGIEKPKTP